MSNKDSLKGKIMNKIDWKIIYVNIAVFIAFVLGISLVFTFIEVASSIQEAEILSGLIVAPIITGAMGFWTYEMKHLFALKRDYKKCQHEKWNEKRGLIPLLFWLKSTLLISVYL